MKILVLGDFRVPWREEAWARSLEDLGHNVRRFPIASYFGGGFISRVERRLLTGPTIRKINRGIKSDVNMFKPDVFLAIRALPVWQETVDHIRRYHQTTMVCYQNDDVFGQLSKKSYWRHFKDSIPHYDLHLVYRSRNRSEYEIAGARETYVLKPYYVPWLHRPVSVRKTVDVGFWGHCEPDHRVSFMHHLMSSVDAEFEVKGARWGALGRGRAWGLLDNSPVTGESYVRAICSGRIALAFFSSWNQDTYTRRSFEIPACKTFMLSERTNDMRQLFEEGIEADYFSSKEELVDKVQFYLQHKAARQRIANAGFRRCTSSGYDVKSRMKEWLSVLV